MAISLSQTQPGMALVPREFESFGNYNPVSGVIPSNRPGARGFSQALGRIRSHTGPWDEREFPRQRCFRIGPRRGPSTQWKDSNRPKDFPR